MDLEGAYWVQEAKTRTDEMDVGEKPEIEAVPKPRCLRLVLPFG